MAEANSAHRLNSLQVLRGLAALWVLLFHMSAMLSSQGTPAEESIVTIAMNLGFGGVDVFFVLSGFVMWIATSRDATAGDPWRFLVKRFARIYLGYWPCLLVSAVAYAVWSPQTLEGRQLIRNLLLFDKNIDALVIGQAWSLVYELYFYLMFFLLLFLPSSQRLRAMLVLYVGVMTYSYMKWQSGSAILSSDTSLTNVFLSPLACEFLSGALLAAFFLRWNSRRVAVRVLLFGIIVTVAASYYGVSAVRGQGLAFVNVEFLRVLSFGSAALGLVAVMIAAGSLGMRWSPLLVRLGDQSFSLYLLHYLIIQMTVASGVLFACHDGQFSAVLCWTVVVVGIVGLTYLYYRFVEHPLYLAACRKIDQLR
jgi:peptidoglycan/LPS O-acetylase OafA/YrhL